MTRYALAITDAACPDCEGEPDCPHCGYRNDGDRDAWTPPCEWCESMPCPGCYGTGTLTVVTDIDATPLAEAVARFVTIRDGLTCAIPGSDYTEASVDVRDAALALFPKEDPDE